MFLIKSFFNFTFVKSYIIVFIYNQHIQHKNTDFGWVLNTQNNAFGEFLLKKLNLVGWIKKGGGYGWSTNIKRVELNDLE